MEKDWVKVFSTTSPFEAEVVKGMLTEHDIDTVLLNRQSSSYNITLPGLVELYVHNSNEATAKSLLETHKDSPTGDPNIAE
jgi:hypothetical protein